MGHESIHEAAGRGDLDTLKKMVEERPWAVDQDDRHGWRPIFHACLRRRLDIVRYLIDRGADLAAHDGYAMHYAAEVPDNKDVVSLLVGYGSLDAHTKPASEVARQFIYAVFLANVPRVDAMLRANPALARERYARGDAALGVPYHKTWSWGALRAWGRRPASRRAERRPVHRHAPGRPRRRRQRYLRQRPLSPVLRRRTRTRGDNAVSPGKRRGSGSDVGRRQDGRGVA